MDGKTFKASDVIGKKLVLLSDKTVNYGSIEAPENTEIWKEGRLTPPVQSYVERAGRVWWLFDLEQPIRYMKHETGTLAIEGADMGGVGSPINLLKDAADRAADALDLKSFRSYFFIVAALAFMFGGVKILEIFKQ